MNPAHDQNCTEFNSWCIQPIHCSGVVGEVLNEIKFLSINHNPFVESACGAFLRKKRCKFELSTPDFLRTNSSDQNGHPEASRTQSRAVPHVALKYPYEIFSTQYIWAEIIVKFLPRVSRKLLNGFISDNLRFEALSSSILGHAKKKECYLV